MPAMDRMRRYRGVVGWVRRMVAPWAYRRDREAARQEREEFWRGWSARLVAAVDADAALRAVRAARA